MPRTRAHLPPQLAHLKAGRGPLVIALAHDDVCPQCESWIASLDDVADDLDEWGARVIVQRDVLQTLHAPALWIADEWGEVYYHWEGEHDFPAPAEILDWARFVAIQCPECEQPEGEWRNI